ncbi:tetratricopeptide repeat protein [Polaromonas sp.]|uniref:tetratricopeptide repeat protein n=1 Tax=Polaromonas sp. TaxID=1869339 RepID=UPI003265CFE7
MSLRRLLVLLILFLVALCLLVAITYWAGIRGTFIFDDFSNIVNNPSLRLFDGSLSSLMAAATSGTSSPLGRPLSMASFALNFFFFGGAPFSFKLTNLLIHIANALLVFGLVRQLLRRLGDDTGTSQSLALAAGITAAWALHPMNATPVLLIVQRMTSLSAFFILSALSLYLYGRHAKNKLGFLAIATSLLVCWPAAILSKETGLLLPIYIFLCEWQLLGTFRSISIKAKWLSLSVIGGLGAAVCWGNWTFITAGYGVRDYDLLERLMTEARVLWFYIRQLLLPAPDLFALFHDDIPVSRGLLAPSETLFAIMAWIGVTALAFHQRARSPLFAFAVFWFLASHLLESTVLPLEIAYEHRNYVASIGIFLWLGRLLLPVQTNVQWLIPRLVLAAAFVFFCGLVTSMRSLQWADEFQRTQMEASNHPDSARANYHAATVAMQRTYELGGGNPVAYQMVQFYFKRAGELDTSSKAPLIGLLYLDCAAGLPQNAVIQSQLRERFSSARFSFGDRAVVHSLSALLVENRLCLDDQEVKKLIEAGLSNPLADGLMRGMINAVAMDYAAAKMRSIPLALTYAQAAVASDPGNVAFRVNLIHLYIQSNKFNEARREYMILASRSLSARDRPGVDGLKNLFDAMGKNANRH